jgi:hypothetical protein
VDAHRSLWATTCLEVFPAFLTDLVRSQLRAGRRPSPTATGPGRGAIAPEHLRLVFLLSLSLHLGPVRYLQVSFYSALLLHVTPPTPPSRTDEPTLPSLIEKNLGLSAFAHGSSLGLTSRWLVFGSLGSDLRTMRVPPSFPWIRVARS